MKTVISFLAAVAAGCFAPAMAHPGPKLLTAGASKEQAAMTPGVQFQEIAGVHLFKGANDLAGAEPPSPSLMRSGRRIEIKIRKDRPFRHIRHLRTQGFYSGEGYATKPYTQGFYSGD